MRLPGLAGARARVNRVADEVSRVLRLPSVAGAVLVACVSLGVGLAALGRDLPRWYAVVTTVLAAKVWTGYRGCSVSYLECRARGVKRERGVVDALVNGPVYLARAHPLLGAWLWGYSAACWWYRGGAW